MVRRPPLRGEDEYGDPPAHDSSAHPYSLLSGGVGAAGPHSLLSQADGGGGDSAKLSSSREEFLAPARFAAAASRALRRSSLRRLSWVTRSASLSAEEGGGGVSVVPTLSSRESRFRRPFPSAVVVQTAFGS